MSNSIYAETREVKAVQKYLSALAKTTQEQVTAKDPIIHTTIENLFLILYSCKSREFLLYMIEHQLTYQFLTSNGVKRALIADLPFVLYSFFRVLMYDPMNAESLGGVFPCFNSNTADITLQSIAGSDYPMAQILKDVSARWVHGQLDVDVIATSVLDQVGNEAKKYTGEHPNDNTQQNIFERSNQYGPLGYPSGRRPSQSLSNASYVYNANSGQPSLIRSPSSTTQVNNTNANGTTLPFGPRGSIAGISFNTQPSKVANNSTSINNNNNNNNTDNEPELSVSRLINNQEQKQDEDTMSSSSSSSIPVASQTPSGPTVPPKPTRPTRPAPRRPSVSAIARVADDDSNDMKTPLSQLDTTAATSHQSPGSDTASVKSPGTVIKQIPAVSLQPYQQTNDKFWAIERAILSQLVANVSALFHHVLTTTLEMSHSISDPTQYQKEANSWINKTFEVLCIAVEELYGWEESSVSFVRLIIYAYVSLLSSKVNQLYTSEQTTVILSLCIIELGIFIEHFVFFRPTGSQTYLNRLRCRNHPSTYIVSQQSNVPSFLSSGNSQQKQLTEQLNAIRDTYQLLNEFNFHQAIFTYRSRLQDLYTNLPVSSSTASKSTGLYTTETSQLPTVIPDFSESVYAQLHRDLTQSLATNTNQSSSKEPPPPPLFGLHFDPNGCADIFIVERYLYLIGCLGFATPEAIQRPSPKEFMPTSYQHNRNLYSTAPSPASPGNLDNMRNSLTFQQGTTSLLPMTYASQNPATNQSWNPQFSRYERGVPLNNAPTQPNGTPVSIKTSSIAGLEIVTPTPVSSTSDKGDKNVQTVNTQAPKFTFKPASNILGQYHHQLQQNMDQQDSSMTSTGLQRSSSLIQQAQPSIQLISKQNFQHLEKMLSTNYRKQFYLTLSKQHSFFKALSEVLVNIFTMPILPSTTLQFPYHNLYNDSVFKQIVPPNTELMISNRLLDQFTTLQHFPQYLITNQLEHYYGPNGQYITDNIKLGETKRFTPADCLDLHSKLQHLQQQQKLLTDYLNDNSINIHSDPRHPQLQINLSNGQHTQVVGNSPLNAQFNSRGSNGVASQYQSGQNRSGLSSQTPTQQSNTFSIQTNRSQQQYLTPQQQHSSFSQNSPTNAFPRSQGSSQPFPPPAILPDFSNDPGNNDGINLLPPLPPPPPLPSTTPPQQTRTFQNVPGQPPTLPPNQIDPNLRRSSNVNIGSEPPSAYHNNNQNQSQQYQQYQLYLQQQQHAVAQQLPPPPQPPVTQVSIAPSPQPIQPQMAHFQSTVPLYQQQCPPPPSHPNTSMALPTAPPVPALPLDSAIKLPHTSYGTPGLALAGTPLFDVPNPTYQFNYMNSHKRDTMFEHQLMFTPHTFNNTNKGDFSIPNGALYTNGAPINAGFNNILTLSQAITSSHNPAGFPFLITEYRSYIGKFINEASERAVFKLIATQLPSFMVEQLKLMMVKRRAQFVQRNALVSNEIQIISDMKWRFALPQAHMRDLQQHSGESKGGIAGVPTPYGSSGNQLLHFPAWAPLIIPAHHIPVTVNSNSHLMTHGLWAPATVPSAIPVVPGAAHGGDIGDYLGEHGSEELRCEINFTSQKVMMPITTTLNESHMDLYFSPILAKGLEVVKANIDQYIEQEGMRLIDQNNEQQKLLLDREKSIAEHRTQLQTELKHLEMEQQRVIMERESLTLMNNQLQAQKYEVDTKRGKLVDEEAHLIEQRKQLEKLKLDTQKMISEADTKHVLVKPETTHEPSSSTITTVTTTTETIVPNTNGAIVAPPILIRTATVQETGTTIPPSSTSLGMPVVISGTIVGEPAQKAVIQPTPTPAPTLIQPSTGHSNTSQPATVTISNSPDVVVVENVAALPVLQPTPSLADSKISNTGPSNPAPTLPPLPSEPVPNNSPVCNLGTVTSLTTNPFNPDVALVFVDDSLSEALTAAATTSYTVDDRERDKILPSALYSKDEVTVPSTTQTTTQDDSTSTPQPKQPPPLAMTPQVSSSRGLQKSSSMLNVYPISPLLEDGQSSAVSNQSHALTTDLDESCQATLLQQSSRTDALSYNAKQVNVSTPLQIHGDTPLNNGPLISPLSVNAAQSHFTGVEDQLSTGSNTTSSRPGVPTRPKKSTLTPLGEQSTAGVMQNNLNMMADLNPVSTLNNPPPIPSTLSNQETLTGPPPPVPPLPNQQPMAPTRPFGR